MAARLQTGLGRARPLPRLPARSVGQTLRPLACPAPHLREASTRISPVLWPNPACFLSLSATAPLRRGGAAGPRFRRRGHSSRPVDRPARRTDRPSAMPAELPAIETVPETCPWSADIAERRRSVFGVWAECAIALRAFASVVAYELVGAIHYHLRRVDAFELESSAVDVLPVSELVG